MVNRVSYLSKNALNFIIFQKILEFDVLNGQFSEGRIVNMIQVDCTKFEQLLINIMNVQAMLLIFLGGIIYMVVLLGGWSVVAFFGAFILTSLLLIVVYKYRIAISKNLMKAKDKRVALLKNVV